MMRKDLPAQRAGRSPEPTLPRKASRPGSPWRAHALALAAALALGLPSQDAFALALGRVSVQSTLGEPLRAEIDVPQITPDEVASLRATLASPDAFRAAGMERSAALADLQISLQQRPNGGYVLRLSSDRAVSEPFVDLILEATWASGRIVRDYTLLFDPPATRPAAPVAAQVTPAPAAEAAPSASAASAPAAPPAAPPATSAASAPPSRAAAPAAPAVRRDAAARSLTVQSGQTAGRIAAANKPPTVSLDQMLVAMLRANPQAFIDGNVNRLKSGAVIDLPSQEQASAVTAGEARQTIVAQSRDFAEFRRRLAEGVGTTAETGGTPTRQAAGRIEAQVQEKKPAETAPDKLTLSKGAVEGRAATAKSNEERIARERADQDMSTRLAELNKNLADLNRLGVASGAAVPGAAASGAGVAVTAAAPTASAASEPAAPASAAASAASAAAPTAAAVAPASAPASRPTAPASATAAGGGVLGFLIDNPLVPAAAGGVLALLAGLVVVRLRRRKDGQQVDSSFLESRLQPDSFFGASGGQRIDTAEEPGGVGTSMVYSPSQIDAAGDVDPVAEADVYLAYGRDLQAEEILKEALRANPQRLAIHTKLLEIYARRRDVQAFERLAAEAHALTGGAGPQWSHIATLGLDLDPANPLYQGGGELAPFTADTREPSGDDEVATVRASLPGQEPVQETGPAELVDAGPATQPQASDEDAQEADEAQALAAATHAPLDFDLSAIDLELPPATAAADRAPPDLAADLPGALPPALPEEPVAPARLPQALMDLDLEIPSLRPPSSPLPERSELAIDDSLDGDLPAPGAPRPAAPLSGMIDFDLSSISLDLEPSAGRAAPAAAAPAAAEDPARAPQADPLADLPSLAQELPTDLSMTLPGDLPGAPTETDPLATKLALAEEFNAIGDIDGARSLAEEVRAEAQGELRRRAERLLGELG